MGSPLVPLIRSIDNIFYQGGGVDTGTITLIPEPSTALLLALGLVGIAARRRRLHE